MSPTLLRERLAASAVLACAVSAIVALSGCAVPALDDAGTSSEAGGELAQGLIDVELRGVSAEHRAALRSLGEVLDDEVVADGPLDELLPRGEREQFLELRTADVAHALEVLRARPDVIYAEREVRVHAFLAGVSTGFKPNDKLYPKQWHLRAAGAEQAWEAARGEGVIVAVLDTGVARLDDIDEARLLPGYNFLTSSGGPMAASDDHFHGTHVAGTIAETTDNKLGGAGMAPLAKILPLKVLGADGSGTSAGIAEAIRYAVDHGAQVINLSLGGGARSLAMEYAVRYARRNGALVVAAAGNTGERGVSYPAAYPDALAVSAVGPSGSLASYSTFGPEVSLAAPGGDKSLRPEDGILQQTFDDAHQAGYRYLQGTSMAAPHVSGAAALVASLGVTDPAAIEKLLLATARNSPVDAPPAQRKERYGAGLLDAGAAVERATTVWGAWRFALALLGAIVALLHARKLQHLSKRESMPPSFWFSLALFSGAFAIAAPLGFARLPVLDVFAMAPAAMPMRFLGAPGASILATLAGYLGFSALVPLVLAGVARMATGGPSRPSNNFLGAVICGLAFGQAGLLLHLGLLGAVHLPGLPPVVAAIWLTANAIASWFAGRAMLARDYL